MYSVLCMRGKKKLTGSQNDHIKSDVIYFLILRHKESTVQEKAAIFYKIRVEKEALSWHSIEILISIFTVLYVPKKIEDTNCYNPKRFSKNSKCVNIGTKSTH